MISSVDVLSRSTIIIEYGKNIRSYSFIVKLTQPITDTVFDPGFATYMSPLDASKVIPSGFKPTGTVAIMESALAVFGAKNIVNNVIIMARIENNTI
jgi:hypothetical protein